MTDRLATRQDTVNQANAGSATRTPAGDAFSELAILVIRLHGAMSAAGDALARPAGQTSARWQVLAGAEAGNATVADIARMLGLARQSVQRVADVLEEEGLVTSIDNPRHRRARLLTLTPAGREALDLIQAGQRDWANRLGRRLGEAELRRTNTTIGKVLAALTADGSARRAG